MRGVISRDYKVDEVLKSRVVQDANKSVPHMYGMRGGSLPIRYAQWRALKVLFYRCRRPRTR